MATTPVTAKRQYKKRVNILLSGRVAEQFAAFRAAHPYWSDSAIGVHLIDLGFVALDRGLEVDWHTLPKDRKAPQAVAD